MDRPEYLTLLPTELWHEILEQCDFQSLENFMLTCQLAYEYGLKRGRSAIKVSGNPMQVNEAFRTGFRNRSMLPHIKKLSVVIHFTVQPLKEERCYVDEDPVSYAVGSMSNLESLYISDHRGYSRQYYDFWPKWHMDWPYNDSIVTMKFPSSARFMTFMTDIAPLKVFARFRNLRAAQFHQRCITCMRHMSNMDGYMDEVLTNIEHLSLTNFW
ncbi:hypothetical protein F4778DRAFT_782181 [Xylariomycetidae sp. FL2044]|nr:hypothetical protein F4778DRAFT_782181 [Xylariomycetidae sp. FL2044]